MEFGDLEITTHIEFIDVPSPPPGGSPILGDAGKDPPMGTLMVVGTDLPINFRSNTTGNEKF